MPVYLTDECIKVLLLIFESIPLRGKIDTVELYKLERWKQEYPPKVSNWSQSYMYIVFSYVSLIENSKISDISKTFYGPLQFNPTWFVRKPWPAIFLSLF